MAASASPIPPYVVVIHAGSKYSPKKLNIDGGDDPFGRYQVPQLLCQVVGKGKMIKTMLLNLDTVAAALQIFPGYIAAWLGYEIGASFKYEAKKPERERGTISGDYTAEKLSTHMHKFIKQVILCRQCKLPELGLKVTGNRTKTVKVVCDSCGENYTLNRISEKFKNYITTHPPPPRKSKDEDVEKKKEQIKQMGDRSATPEPGSSSSSSASSSSAGPEVAPTLLHDMATGEVIDLDAVADSAAERLQSSASPAVESSNVEWSVDTSEAAAESRQLALVPDAVKQLIGSSIDDTAPWLEADITDPEAILETGVLRQREHQEIISCLFARVFASLTSLERFAPVLKASAATLHKYFSKEADFQLHFLDALIPFIASSPDLLPHTKGLLHGFYQADVLEEDSILSWWQNHHQDLAHEITQAAQPFIEWLQQADSDDDDDDDDDDDEDEDGNDEE